MDWALGENNGPPYYKLLTSDERETGRKVWLL